MRSTAGLTELAIIHVNNDFGVNMMREFSSAYEALGGTITSVTPYNEKQSSYAAEATAGDGGRSGRALPHQLSCRRRDHRARLDQPGRAAGLPPQRRHELDRLHRGRRRAISSATPTAPRPAPARPPRRSISTPITRPISGGIAPDAPAADRSYDAGAIVGLAIAKASIDGGGFEAIDADGIAAAIPAVLDHGRRTRLRRSLTLSRTALERLSAGEPIRYEGVIGPVQFDQYGDITGPFRLWTIEDGVVTTAGEMSADEVGTDQGRDRRASRFPSR